MIWNICFFLTVICLVMTALWLVLNKNLTLRKVAILDSPKILFVGVTVSATIMFLPIYISTFNNTQCGVFEAVFMSIHNMIRLFIVDGDFEIVRDNIGDVNNPLLSKLYTGLLAILFLVAPLLTFGFVMSFFKNFSSYVTFLTHYNNDTYIFSKLNDKSLSLAESLCDNKDERDRFFIFMDCDKSDEFSTEYINRAKRIKSVMFGSNINNIAFKVHNKKKALYFFTIGEDVSQNVTEALTIIDRYKYRDNTHLYVFSTQEETELLLLMSYENVKVKKDENEPELKIKVRRVDDTRSLILRTLYETGYEDIFDKAIYDEETKLRNINALVVGMGDHGTNMVKNLSWFCQMDGYRVEINAFDLDENIESKFISQCPELMSEKFNGVYNVEGEAQYKISIYGGVDVDTVEFDNMVKNIDSATYVFVALGNDEKNISIAAKLRSLYERLGLHPVIKAVVYNSEKCKALKGIKNFSGQYYDIDFIGDLATSYSEDVIINSDLEAKALKRHLEWGEEDQFWQYEYNYSSSIASAIHRKMKVLCGIPEAEYEPSERKNENNIRAIRVLEHRRWNAYMRSIGYSYSGNVNDKTTRNNLAKVHHLLVPFDELPYKEQIKDDD